MPPLAEDAGGGFLIETKQIMILVTHTDLDGIGSEVVVRYFTSLPEANIQHCSYNNIDTTVRKLLETTTCEIVITDLSVTPETAAHIEKNYADRVMLYDHHKTAKTYLDAYKWAVVDITRSGTQIIFEVLCARHPHIPVLTGLTKFVFHVNDHDLWQHVSPDSSRINDMLFLLGRELFAQIMLDRISHEQPLIAEVDRYYLQGLQRTKQKYFAERVKRAVPVANRLVLVASLYLSELCQYIRNISPPPAQWQNVAYIDILNFDAGAHTLRSYKPDFDVSEIAQAHGGGGHHDAAGYPIQVVNDSEWLRLW
jgi:oligoribonuclease NrnB/cAMP/cGMP phosphodiesterase (DHH superfamily)